MTQDLVAAVERAIQRLRAEGIEGWGLRAPDDLWDEVIVDDWIGCDSETCQHVSHDGAARTRRLIPRAGTLALVGGDGACAYYTLTIDDDTRAYQFRDEPAYRHAWLRPIALTGIPEYLLAALGEEEE